MESKTVEAVGLARMPGSTNVIRDAKRLLMRVWLWVLMNKTVIRHVPYDTQERFMMWGLRWFRKRSIFAGASLSDAAENGLMLLIFNATTWANIAINATSSPLTALSVALHTSDPGESGSQSTSEVSYTSYARVDVNRNSGGWTVTNNSVSPASNITFPAGTGGSGTVTHFSVGKTGGGATAIIFSGTVTPNIVSGNGVTPQLSTATAITLD